MKGGGAQEKYGLMDNLKGYRRVKDDSAPGSETDWVGVGVGMGGAWAEAGCLHYSSSLFIVRVHGWRTGGVVFLLCSLGLQISSLVFLRS